MNVLSYKLNKFLSNFNLIRYKKGETILRAGDNPQGVLFIKKGFVKDYSISKDGEELILIIFRPDDFFPLRWALNDSLSNHYFETMSEVELWKIPRDQFIDFLKDNADVLLELTQFILVRMDGVIRRMEHMAFGNAYDKVASIIAICADRFGKKENNGILIGVPLTHKDIANLVGITRETVSIEIKKLERKGIIGYKDKLVLVKNKAELEKSSILY